MFSHMTWLLCLLGMRDLWHLLRGWRWALLKNKSNKINIHMPHPQQCLSWHTQPWQPDWSFLKAPAAVPFFLLSFWRDRKGMRTFLQNRPRTFAQQEDKTTEHCLQMEVPEDGHPELGGRDVLQEQPGAAEAGTSRSCHAVCTPHPLQD